MHGILSRVQAACGAWVGLSVVHLGDRDVPNALMFIDKVAACTEVYVDMCMGGGGGGWVVECGCDCMWV